MSIFQALYRFEQDHLDEFIFKYLITNRKITEGSISKFNLFNLKNPDKTIEFLKDKFSDYELLVSGLFVANQFIFKKHRLIIPYLEHGKIIYLRARYFDRNHDNGRHPKYKSLSNASGTLGGKRFYNVDVLENTTPEILILEGEFDTIIASQLGYPAIGIPGVSSFPDKQIELLRNRGIILLFDNDDPGQNTANKIGQTLSNIANSVEKWILPKPYKDLTEYANAIT
jgi:DNA primase